MKTLDLVQELLEVHEHCRDNDGALVCNVWACEIKRKFDRSYKNMSAEDIMRLIANNKITSYGTITRARRKLQEEYIHLRGNRYNERKTKLTNAMKKSLGYETT